MLIVTLWAAIDHLLPACDSGAHTLARRKTPTLWLHNIAWARYGVKYPVTSNITCAVGPRVGAE